jgi:hypothetical protein
MTANSSNAIDADEWILDYRGRLEAAVNRRPRPEGVQGEQPEKIVICPVPDR